MFTFFETVDGRIVWPRRRSFPGPGGLGWHMSAVFTIEPSAFDSGLLTGSLEEMTAVANSLSRSRLSSGMESSVEIVELQSDSNNQGEVS